MIRFAIYAILGFLMTIVAWILAPVLPLFAQGAWLPRWLSWFQTPDNDLDGDRNEWTTAPMGSYRRRVAWLIRNPAYGFDYFVLEARIEADGPIRYKGDPLVCNRPAGRHGWLFATAGSYFHFRWCFPLWSGECVDINLGWRLQEFAQQREAPAYASFVCSIRATPFVKALP